MGGPDRIVVAVRAARLPDEVLRAIGFGMPLREGVDHGQRVAGRSAIAPGRDAEPFDLALLSLDDVVEAILRMPSFTYSSPAPGVSIFDVLVLFPGCGHLRNTA